MSDGSPRPGKPGSASLAAMYQEALLAHHRAPHNRHEMEDATGSATHKSPVCGDDIRVFVRVANDLIEDVSFVGRGCSVSTASASMMTDTVRGLSKVQVRSVFDSIEKMLASGNIEQELPETLHPIRSVAAFQVRHECVRMPWLALNDAIG